MKTASLLAGQGASVRELRSKATLSSERRIEGFVFDPHDLDSKFVVELLLDGYPTQVLRANIYDEALGAEGVGDGCYRFLFAIDSEVAQAAVLAEVRLANTGELVGAQIRLDLAPPPPDPRMGGGEVHWNGGLRLSGWISDRNIADGQKVRALVDGAVVAEARADLWGHVGEGALASPVRAFVLTLPLHMADGRVRRVRVVDVTGRDLVGSPCAFLAFENGLARFLEGRADLQSERLRAEMFDRLMPQSMPLSDFGAWIRAFPPETALRNDRSRIAVALVGETNLASSVESLERQREGDWVVGALARGEDATAFRADDLRQFLAEDAKDCEILVFSVAGVVFHPFALGRLAEALAAFPQSKLAYCDVTIADASGGEWPIAFTAFDYERLLEQGCGAFVFAARAAHVRDSLANGAADLFRLFNTACDEAGPRDPHQPVHVPGFLARLPPIDAIAVSPRLEAATQAHLGARGSRAETKPGFGALFPAVRVHRAVPAGKVSILIPTRDRVDLLKPCLDSLERTLGDADAEIIVIDNDSSHSETFAYFEEIAQRGVRVAKVRGAFNFARIANAGASIARGEFLLFLNNDVEALQVGWLQEMMGRMAEPDVGAVGALLLWPSQVIQHGGIVLGLEFVAGHAFTERMADDRGYGDLLAVAHEGSAVTGACLLTRRRLFQDLGGFDGANFPVNFNDVDFCLRLRARGFRIVFTPHARLLHRESASRGRALRPAASARASREVTNLRNLWGETLINDPFYSPLLSLDEVAYAGLAWPPRSQAPRKSLGMLARRAPPGF